MRLATALAFALSACGSAAGVVHAPANAAASPSGPDRAEHAGPVACDKPWSVDVIGGDGRVVVACPGDVQRVPLDPAGPMARALAPALDPARERICGCIGRVKAPPFVDLVFTANPEEGRVTVQADDNGDVEPEVGPPFVACIGTIVATFAPVASQACPDGAKASVVYPVRLELE